MKARKIAGDDGTPLPLQAAGSGRRAAQVVDAWDLVRLSAALPVDAGVRGVSRAFVERLQRLAPDLAVGACVTASEGEPQIIEYRLPDQPGGELGRDPTRLFPHMAFERVIGIGHLGSTLHVAGDDPRLSADDSEHAVAFDCAGTVLAGALRNARAFDHRRASGGGIEKLRAQLIQAEKLASLGQVVAGVVHELNNPLTSIVAYADFLKRKAEKHWKDPDDVERLRRIGEAAERILSFARDLVAYARPTHDVPAAVLVHAVIDKALVFCEHDLGDSRVEVVRDFGSDPHPVRGIGGQLTQVFVNLFINASHAMKDSGGTLRVSTFTDVEGARFVVEVADTGTGIAQEVIERVFEPFFTTKPEGSGTGLGLAIAHEIVTSHGGAIDVESTFGAGTVFRVELPLATSSPSSRP